MGLPKNTLGVSRAVVAERFQCPVLGAGSVQLGVLGSFRPPEL